MTIGIYEPPENQLHLNAFVTHCRPLQLLSSPCACLHQSIGGGGTRKLVARRFGAFGVAWGI